MKMDSVENLMGKENREVPGVKEIRHDIADWTWHFVMGCSICLGTDIDYENEPEFAAMLYKSSVAKSNILRLTKPDYDER